MQIYEQRDGLCPVKIGGSFKDKVTSEFSPILKLVSNLTGAEYHLVLSRNTFGWNVGDRVGRAIYDGSIRHRSDGSASEAVNSMLSLCSFVESANEITFSFLPIFGRVYVKRLKYTPKYFWDSSLDTSVVIFLPTGDGKIDIAQILNFSGLKRGASDLIQRMPQVHNGAGDKVPEPIRGRLKDDLEYLNSGLFVYFGDDFSGLSATVDISERFNLSYVVCDLGKQKPRAIEKFFNV